MRAAFARVLLQHQPHAKVGAPDAPAGIDTRPEQEAEMPRFGRTGQARGIHQRGQAGMIAPPQRDQPLGDKGAVEAFERHHVGDGAERDQMQHRQQIGFGSRAGPESALAQRAGDGDQGDKNKANGRQMAKSGKIVGAVRVDDRDRGREFLVGLVMVDHHHFETELAGLFEGYRTGGAAIDRHQQLDAAFGKRADRVDIGAVTLENPVRNMDGCRTAALPQVIGQQRRRGGTVDVVVAENRDAFSLDHGVGNARGGLSHAGQRVRVGHQPLDGRVEIGLRVLGLDATAGEHARQQFG